MLQTILWFAESFLVITAMVLVYAVDELLQMRIVSGQPLYIGQLSVVTLTASIADACLIIGRNKKRRTTAEIAMKLGEEDAYACKVEITEMDVFVWYASKPLNKVVALILRVS